MDSARRDAWEADLTSNLAWVRRLALAIVRDDALADDVAQDVMWTALRSHDRRPTSLGGLRAWLKSVVRSTAIDRARSESARRSREQAVSRSEAEGGSPEAVERGARSQRVVEAVMQLAEPYRSVILLRYLDQLPMAEVARRTDASETTVRKRVTIGLGLLRTRLDREFGTDARGWATLLLGTQSQAARTSIGAHVGIAAVIQGVILMHVKWIAAGVAVVLLGLIAWRAHASVERETGTLTRGTKAVIALTELAKPAVDATRSAAVPMVASVEPTSQAVSSSGPFLIVRSSVGLPLPFVDLQDALGDWQRAALDHDHCAIDPTIPFPRMVRAPGHVPQSATKAGQDLSLEPDALLTLEAHDLRKRMRAIRIENGRADGGSDPADQPLLPELEHACAFAFLSDDMWCLAISHDLVNEAFVDPFDVELLWPDHHRGDVQFRVTAGMRARWTVPVDECAPGAPLHLHVHRPDSETSGDVLFLLQQTDLQGIGSGVEYLPWGRVSRQGSTLWMDEQRLSLDKSDFTLDFLPTGVRIEIAAHDTSTGAYGRIGFVHDGSDRTLELLPGFVLEGRFLAGEDRQPVTSGNFIWEFHDGPETKYIWRYEGFPLVTDPSGKFQARGPKNFIIHEMDPLQRPSLLTIEFNAPGFESLHREFVTGGAVRFDCGELLLTRSTPQLVLAPDHDLSSAKIKDASLRFSGSPGVTWAAKGATANPDGSLNVFLWHSEDSTAEIPRFSCRSSRSSDRVSEEGGLPWPAESSHWLSAEMYFGDGEQAWLFERQTDGRYAALPRRHVDIVVKCSVPPPSGRTWWLGWILEGQWGYMGQAPKIPGETAVVHASMPVGAQMWWSDSESPPGMLGAPKDVGGSIAIDGKRSRIELR